MKNFIQALSFFFIILSGITNAQSQQISTNLVGGAEVFVFQLKKHDAIHSSRQNNKHPGIAYHFGISGSREIQDRWAIGLNFGTVNSYFKWKMEQEVFSITYKTQHYRWGADLKYALRENKDKIFQNYLSAGLEHRILADYNSKGTFHNTEFLEALLFVYSFGQIDIVNHYSNENLPEEEKAEIVDFYNQGLSKHSFGFNVKYLMKFQFKNGFSFGAEPYLNFMVKNYQSEFIKNQVGMGANFFLGLQF